MKSDNPKDPNLNESDSLYYFGKIIEKKFPEIVPVRASMEFDFDIKDFDYIIAST